MPMPADGPPSTSPACVTVPTVTAKNEGAAGKSPWVSGRNLLELAVLLVATVLLVRSFLVEAYIVPTGSMAPALVGHHKFTICSCCGAPVRVGHRGSSMGDLEASPDREAGRHYRRARCSNCGWDELAFESVPECLGDRLLVHKHIYELRAPRRWEMVVFRNPDPEADPTSDTLIKRLVGLPGEQVQIRDGDVWVNGAIVRKDVAQLREVQSLVFDNDHQPRDAPQPFRWAGAKGSGWRARDGGRQFVFKERKRPTNYDWLVYRHLVRDPGRGWSEDQVRDALGYNGGEDRGSLVHDLLLDCQLRVSGSGTLALALTDGLSDVLVELPVGAGAERAKVRQMPSRQRSVEAGPLKTCACSLPEQRAIHLQVGIADRRVFIVVDNREVFGTLDLPSSEASGGRAPLGRALALDGFGPISIGARGIAVTVANLRMWRDVHYTESDGREAFTHGLSRPVSLGPAEFFVLGDNSSNSYDSRCWKAGPAVPADLLVGKAFVVHLPSRVVYGRFLGRTWTAHTPDWGRIHWLR